MRRDDLEQMWNDWLRGTLLVVLVLILVVLYALDVFTKPTYALILTGTLLFVGIAASLQYCLDVPVPKALSLVSPLVGMIGAILVYLTIRSVLFPAPPLVETELSSVNPEVTVELPENVGKELHVWVKGHPGVLPSGDDRRIEARFSISQSAIRDELKIELMKGAKKKGKGKGIGISDMTSDMQRLEGFGAGSIHLKLNKLKPSKALPLEISFHRPALPTRVVTWVLATLLAITLVISFFTLKGRIFPFILPFSMVMVVVQHLIAKGFSPTEPLLPLLGIIMGGGILTSALGYLLGKGLQWITGTVFAPKPVGKTGGKNRKHTENGKN